VRAGDPTSAPSGLVEAEDLAYHYDGRAAPALSGCSLRIQRGDRLVLEGASGSGKSTLAALLSGLRQPTGGRLLLDGVDHASVGVAAWRQAVVTSPQFHENHVLLGPLLFNLLVGRRWPPQPEDVQEAHELCLALGLGPVLDRMPGGLQQMVGDTGWQLSHGERSLLFLGRALLQRSRLVLLDETFGSLDPETMQRALGVAMERAETLVVIRQ
jgi:ATP-binding cassette subfamily B protein